MKQKKAINLAINLQVKGDNIEKRQLEDLVEKANQIWPYSEAKRENMEFHLRDTVSEKIIFPFIRNVNVSIKGNFFNSKKLILYRNKPLMGLNIFLFNLI